MSVLARARALVAAAERVVVLSGAGISTESGIPDFRGPNGLWTTSREPNWPPSFQSYLDSPEIRRKVWQTRLTHPSWQAEPNDAHRALVELERAGTLRAILTQNID